MQSGLAHWRALADFMGAVGSEIGMLLGIPAYMNFFSETSTRAARTYIKIEKEFYNILQNT